MWSPQSQRKWYQLRSWYSVSLQLGLALVSPDGPSVPVDAARGHVADRPVVNPLHALDVAGLVAALGAGDDGQFLVLGLLVGGQHLADAGAVDGDGLLGEEVLAGLDRWPRCAGAGSPAAWPASPGRSSRSPSGRRRSRRSSGRRRRRTCPCRARSSRMRSRQFLRWSWNTSPRAWSLML